MVRTSPWKPTPSISTQLKKCHLEGENFFRSLEAICGEWDERWDTASCGSSTWKLVKEHDKLPGCAQDILSDASPVSYSSCIAHINDLFFFFFFLWYMNMWKWKIQNLKGLWISWPQSFYLAHVQGCEMPNNHSNGGLWSLLKWEKVSAHLKQKQAPVITG